jgi:protein TonB
MSSHAATLEKYTLGESSSWEPAKVITLNTANHSLAENFNPTAIVAAIGSFKFNAKNNDHKLIDYFLIGVLTLLVHNTVISHFEGLSFEQEIVEAIKPPPKVQITLTRPKPKPIAPPPPIVQPKPPVVNAVPLKPQKPKPVPKVVEQAPPPNPSPVAEAVPTAPTAPATPAPVVQEKVTAPTAGADYLHNPAPEYPDLAQEMAWEGKVLLKVHVQADGKPNTVSLAKSSGHKELDDAAIKAVNKWSFVPAMRGDTPVDGWVTVPISFNL